MKQIKIALLLFTFLLTGMHSWGSVQETPCLQIFFDEAPPEEPNRFFGRIHALFIQNLMGHFPHWHQIVSPIHSYRSGQLEACEASIYLGTYFRSEIPETFLSDFLKTKKQVLWAGYNLWKFTEEELSRAFGMAYKGLTRLEPNPISPKKPNFFKYFHYKGERFEKYGEVDSQDPARFNSAFELVFLEPLVGKAPKAQVVSWAEHSGSQQRIPYVIVNENRWFIADSPFSFATEKDRYLIFTDLIFDLLGESPRYGSVRPAFVRFEDIHPNLPLWQLGIYLKMFKEAGVPFAISLIPIFADPLMAEVDDPAFKILPITRQKQFVEFLKRAEASESSIIFHGITHQYKNIKNPFNGMSGDDFEFWDGNKNQPIAEDSAPYVLDRLEDGWELLQAVGITPIAWLTPHYQASPLDFVLFGQLFRWNVGRVTYFPFKRTDTQKLTTDLTFDSRGSAGRSDRLKAFSNVAVSFPKDLKPNGQFFPFEIWGDVYGQCLLPENLGNIQPFLNEQVYKTQKPDEMLDSAKRNRVLRDHWASLFIHPVLVQPIWDEGLGEFPGDARKIIRLLQEIRSLGYEFIDLKQWVQKQPLLPRPIPKEIVYADS